MRFAYALISSICLDMAPSLALDPQWAQDSEATTATPPPSSSWFSLPVNKSNMLAPTAVVTCDGDKFGFGLVLISCNRALAEIPQDDQEVSFGRRHTGAFAVNLPYLFMSRKYRALKFYLRWISSDEETFPFIDKH